MFRLSWDIGIFEAVRVSWRTELADDGDTLNVNRAVFWFMTRNFANGILVRLRKVTEAGQVVAGRKAKSDRSIYSLRSVLSDMAKYREEYTRRRLFLAKNTEYDLELLERQQHDDFHRKVMGQPSDVPMSRGPYPTRMLHQSWDKLCGVSSSERSPDDVLSADYLELLITETENVHSRIESYVNKNVVHAASEPSRLSAMNDGLISISEMCDHVVKSARLVNTISELLCCPVNEFIGTPGWDLWENWTNGWTAPREVLQEAWGSWQHKMKRPRPILPSRPGG